MHDAFGGYDMGGVHDRANQQSRPHMNMGGRTPGEGQCAGGTPGPRGWSGRGGAAGRGGRGAEGGREGERRRSAHDMQLFRHISDSESTGDICQLIEAHVTQFDPVNVSMAFKKLLNSRRDGMPRGIHSRARALSLSLLSPLPLSHALSVTDPHLSLLCPLVTPLSPVVRPE